MNSMSVARNSISAKVFSYTYEKRQNVLKNCIII